MHRHDPSDFVVPDQFWEKPEVDEVLRARDAGALFQLVRKYAGASQTGLTMRTGIAKSEISAIMAGNRRVTTLDRFESIADGLDMPDAARVKLGLAPRGHVHSVKPTSAVAGASPSPRVPVGGNAGRVWNILPPVRGFRGRDVDIARIADELLKREKTSGVSSIAVHGIAGVGKTQLARAFAEAHKDDFRLGWWISAETRLDLATGIGQLAVRLGASEDWSPPELINYLFDELRHRDSWILIFDNATNPAEIESFVPADGGSRSHVIITSRSPAWRTLAVPLAIDVMPVDSASELLNDWSHDNDTSAAEALAKELGQLPLAIEQAAAYTVDTASSLRDYLELFRAERSKVLQRESAITYPGTVAATVILAMDKLALTAPMAMRLLEICSLCSPDDLPLRQFLTVLQNLDDPRMRNLDAVGRLDVLGSLRQSGLLRWDGDDTVRLHRLTKVVIEDRIGSHRQRVIDAVELMTALFPRTPSEPENWPTCAQLASHATSILSHARMEDLVNESLAALLTRVGRYFLCSGLSFIDARDLHSEALTMRRSMHRGDHPETARGLVHLAVDLNELGDSVGAKELHENALAMRQRIYAQDHPDVAHSLDNLGNVLHILSEYEAARQHHELGLEMRQRLYADDHPNVAYSLSNLAGDLHQLGDVAQARRLNERALAIRQRLVPGDHPDIGHSLNTLRLTCTLLVSITRR